MIRKRTLNHPRMHITTQTQFQPQAPPHDLSLHILRHLNHVAYTIRLILQQRPQLVLRRQPRRLRKVDRCFQALCARGAERTREDRDVAYARVAAEINANDALGTVLRGEGDDIECRGGGGAAVDGEDQVRFHGRGGGVGGGDAGEDQLGVLLGGEVRGGDGARGGAELEVDDAVCAEGVQHGGRGVGDGCGVGDEAVDVAREEGEESGEWCCEFVGAETFRLGWAHVSKL